MKRAARAFGLGLACLVGAACIPELVPEGPLDQGDSSDETACAPNEVTDCSCPSGEAGWQVCDVDGDGFSACECEGPGEPYTPRCGDGLITLGEICDDGNLKDGDGCDADCTAPPGTLVWSTTYSGLGDGDDRAVDVTTDALGNIYVAGFDGNGGMSRAWLRKYTPAGTQIWTHTYIDEARGPHESSAVTIDEEGGVVLVGRSLDAADDWSAWVRKLDASGEHEWTHTYEGAGYYRDAAHGVAIGKANSIVVCGEHSKIPQDAQIWVLKLSSVGVEMWSALVGESGDDWASDCAVNSEGDVVVAGNEYVDGVGYRLWVGKFLDMDGTLDWTATEQTTLGSGGSDASIAIDDQDYVYVVSEAAEAGTENVYIWIGQYTAAKGKGLEWFKTIEEVAEGSRGLHVAVDAFGRVAIAGAAWKGESTRDDIWLQQRESADGANVWTQTRNGPAAGNDGAFGVAVDQSGGIFVAGVQEVDGRGLDMWVGKYAP